MTEDKQPEKPADMNLENGNDASQADGSAPDPVSRRAALKTGLASVAGILTVSPALTGDGKAAGIFSRMRDLNLSLIHI